MLFRATTMYTNRGLQKMTESVVNKNKRRSGNKRLTEARMSWKKVKDSIKQSLDDGIDPFYEETDAAMYVETIMQKVEEQEDIFLEPSIQAGRGGMFFYHGDKQTGEQDYQEFNQTIAEMVLDCSGPKEFSSYYSSMLDDYHDYSDDDDYDDEDDYDYYDDKKDHKVDSPVHAFYDKEGNLLDKNGKSIKNRSKITEITVADDVTSIPAEAFRKCYGLTSIKIPDTVTSIGEWAFSGCSSLTSINIPNGVTSIGYEAFCNCSSLTSIKIPDSVTSIGDYAFLSCMNLTSIDIPNSVTNISTGAFHSCSSLTSINIPNGVTSIGSYAFYGCHSLTNIEIPNSVTSIGEDAFYGCSSLTSINIPNSVTSIGEDAFLRCSNLKTVYLENPNTKYEEYTFPEHTEIIKKGVNESMKIRKNELTNLRRAKKLLENNGYEVTKLNEARITDYISSDELHKLINLNIDKFGEGDFSTYQSLDGMVVKTTKYHDAFPGRGQIERFWKFTKNGDGEWEVYEVNDDTTMKQIGKPFVLTTEKGRKNTIHESSSEDDYDDFLHDIYDDLVKVLHKYRYKKGISQEDFEMAIEFFINHFFENDDYWEN